jgi:hypothetical protein
MKKPWIGCFLPRALLPPNMFSVQARAAEKQASRDQDYADISSGRKTVEQVNRENGAFAFPREMVTISYRGRKF